MMDLAGSALSQEERELLRHPYVGGVIFFSRNFVSVRQLQELVAEIRALRPQLLLAVDQEGGRVQRFLDGFTRLPAMQQLAAVLKNEPDKAALQVVRDTGWLMAAELLACGLDFSFAPVLDLDDCGCAAIGDRSFSPDPQRAVTAARAFIEGMHEAGMVATGKHFPGHGGVRADSHLETPSDPRSLEQLLSRDLLPFTDLSAQLDAVMPAHIIFPAVDSQPVGFSRIWLQHVLRQQLSFDGVIFSDDLSMKGADVAGGYAEKVAHALAAGCDMALICNNRQGVIEALRYLAGTPLLHNPRLTAMAARKLQDWHSLRTDPRWRRARAQLMALAEKE